MNNEECIFDKLDKLIAKKNPYDFDAPFDAEKFTAYLDRNTAFEMEHGRPYGFSEKDWDDYLAEHHRYVTTPKYTLDYVPSYSHN